jgi:hypothetical protein
MDGDGVESAAADVPVDSGDDCELAHAKSATTPSVTTESATA